MENYVDLDAGYVQLSSEDKSMTNMIDNGKHGWNHYVELRQDLKDTGKIPK